MDSKWTKSVANSKGPAPDMTPVEITPKLTVPREAITITAYMLGTMFGLKPSTTPRWRFQAIVMTINHLFPATPDLNDEGFEPLVGFACQPSEMTNFAAAVELLDDKLVQRVEAAWFQAKAARSAKK